MAVDVAWEAAELAAVLTTYISGIEESCKPPMLRAVAYANEQVGAPFETLEPIMRRAFESVEITLPGE